MIGDLRALSGFDPEHLPGDPEGGGIHHRTPSLPQVACFDTAFHHNLPRIACILPIPRRFEAMRVRRYGFHGLSYQFLLSELGRLDGTQAAAGRLILVISAMARALRQ